MLSRKLHFYYFKILPLFNPFKIIFFAIKSILCYSLRSYSSLYTVLSKLFEWFSRKTETYKQKDKKIPFPSLILL